MNVSISFDVALASLEIWEMTFEWFLLSLKGGIFIFGFIAPSEWFGEPINNDAISHKLMCVEYGVMKVW